MQDSAEQPKSVLEQIENVRLTLREVLSTLNKENSPFPIDEVSFNLLMDRKLLLNELLDDIFSAAQNKWVARNVHADRDRSESDLAPNEVDQNAMDDAPKQHEKTPHDFGFDCLLLTALKTAPLNKPVGLKAIHDLAFAYDPRRKPASVTTKMSRWRSEGLVEWRDSNDRKLTGDGQQLLTRIQGYVSEDAKHRIREAILSVLGLTISL